MEHLGQLPVDSLLVSSLPNVRYLSGFMKQCVASYEHVRRLHSSDRSPVWPSSPKPRWIARSLSPKVPAPAPPPVLPTDDPVLARVSKSCARVSALRQLFSSVWLLPTRRRRERSTRAARPSRLDVITPYRAPEAHPSSFMPVQSRGHSRVMRAFSVFDCPRRFSPTNDEPIAAVESTVYVRRGYGGRRLAQRRRVGRDAGGSIWNRPTYADPVCQVPGF